MIGEYSAVSLGLGCVVSVLVGFILYLVGSMAYIMWRSKQNLEFYRKQGGVIRFYPLLGPLGLESRSAKENLKGSNYNLNIKLASENPSAIFTATNMVGEPSCVVQIHNSELLKEFLLKEDLFLKSALFDEAQDSLGFFFHNGETAFKEKAVFSKIFKPEGMEVLIPKICRIVQAVFAKIEQERGITKDSHTRISLQDIYQPILDGITELVIFGKENLDPNEDMIELRRLHVEMMMVQRKITLSPIFNLLPNVCKRFGLLGLGRFAEIMNKQAAILERLVNEREKAENLGESVIDRIVLHHRECRASGNTQDILSPYNIAGQYNIFQIAGSETSKATTKTAICMMADKPHIKDWWLKVVSQIYNSEGLTTQDVINSCEDLTLCVKETLRMHVPLPRLFLKKATRDLSLGSLQIKKDDYISVQIASLNYSPIHFKDPHEFKPERFRKEEEKKLPKYQFIPFSVGKRVCMGRYLGELMVQLLVSQFVRHYDFQKPADVDYYQYVFESIAVENPWVEVKKKL